MGINGMENFMIIIKMNLVNWLMEMELISKNIMKKIT